MPVIKKLSTINCCAFGATLKSDFKNFNVQNFLKDNPPPTSSGKKRFIDGLATFGKSFYVEDSDYHVHTELLVVKIKSTKKFELSVTFCTSKEHLKLKNKKKLTITRKDDFMNFFSWLKKYVLDLSMIQACSDSMFVYSNKKYDSVIKLPSEFNIPTSDDIDLGEPRIKGLNLDFRKSKVGVGSVIIQAEDDDIIIGVDKCTNSIDDNYFSNTLDFTSKFSKIFIREKNSEAGI